MDGNQNKATGKQPIRIDMDGLSEGPQHREVHHRRALSDTSYRYDDFLLFDPSDLDLSSLDLLPYPTATNSGATPAQPMSVDSSDDSSSNQNANQGQNPPRPKPVNHLRSLSVDSDFFDSLGLTAGDDGGKSAGAVSGGREKRSYHRHSNSMDGATLASFEVDSVTGDGFSKRSVDRDRLAELALIDPKRAKRILANRQSAARSKERKIRYTNELERKVQTLQTEATTLSAQITMVQRDTNDLNNKNKELKLRLQAMEEEAKLRKALSEALREELQRLKMSAGQMPAGNGNPYGLALPPQFPQHQLPMHQFGGHQPHQQQQQPPQQQHQQMPQASTNNNQTFGRQSHPNFMNFNQRV